MSISNNRSKKVIFALVGIIIAICMVFCGIGLLNKDIETTEMKFSVYSTTDGTYYNASNGGTISVNGITMGINSTLSLSTINASTIKAMPNEGFGFAGFYSGDELLTRSIEYNFEASESVNRITAKFAKLYPINLTLDDPFDTNKKLLINKDCYVGQNISTYELVNEFYGEEYAEYFKNSTAVDISGEESSNLLLAESSIVMGSSSATLAISPTDPVMMGLPSGYKTTDQYIIIYGATGIEDYGINGTLADGLVLADDKSNTSANYKAYQIGMAGTKNTWCYISKFNIYTVAKEKYVLGSMKMRYYNTDLYYKNNNIGTSATYYGWTNYVDPRTNGISSSNVGAVEIVLSAALGVEATFYADDTTVYTKTTYAKNSSYSMPSTPPNKDGFTFAGWTSSKTSNSAQWTSGTKTITKNTVWYPVWKRENVLTYAYITSSGARSTWQDTESTTEYFSCQEAFPTEVEFEIDQVKNLSFVSGGKEYVFVGFSTSATSYDTVYGNFDDVNEKQPRLKIYGKRITLYAIYETKLTVSYDATWGYDAPADEQVSMYKSPGSSAVTTSKVQYPLTNALPKIEAGEFKSWVWNNTSYNPGDIISFTDNIKVSAEWTLSMILPGAGTERDPYTISSVGEFKSFMACVNDGQYGAYYFQLLTNLELDFIEPVGTYNTIEKRSYPFRGIFDGNGKTITFNDDLSERDYVGLFGYNEGTIKNLTVKGSISGQNYVAGLCGYNTGLISNCFSEVQVSGTGSYIGGIVGVNNGIVDKCYNKGNIVGSNSTFGLAVGGVIGINISQNQVLNLINEGTVTAEAYQWVGGVVGQNHGAVINIYNTEDVVGAYYVGGLVGQNADGSIINGYNIGKIQSKNTYAGAIVGMSTGTIETLYYFVTSASDGNGTIQKSVGTATLGASIEEDKLGISSFNTYSVQANITMSDGIQRGLLYALNMGLEVLIPENNFEYCVWEENENANASMCINGKWTEGLSDGASVIGWTGTGTMYDPYQIGSVGDFQLLAEKVNLGMTYKDTYFLMTYDIYFGHTEDWIPVGAYNTDLAQLYVFEGVFNGDRHVVSGLNLDLNSDYVGLFGNNAGTIQNIIIENSTIIGNNYVGSVVGYNTGTIINCTNVSATVTAKKNYAGGVCGYNAGLLDKAVNQATITGQNSSSGQYVGGLTGYATANSKIRNSFNIGIVQATQYQNVGGIVGYNDGRVTNIFNKGNINGKVYIGGLVGQNKAGKVQNGYSTGKIVGTNNYVASLVGANTGEVMYCYYLQGTATDGSNKVQNAIGRATKGQVTQDNTNNVMAFTGTNDLVAEKRIEGQTTFSLLVALNAGQQFYNIKEQDMYLIWTSAENVLPTLLEGKNWNTSKLWAFEGHGTEINPFLIQTADDLFYLSLFVNAGYTYQGQYFKMTNDIVTDYSIEENNHWVPIANYDQTLAPNIKFAGTFDGNLFSVSNLQTAYARDNQGMFGYSTGVIKNLGVVSSAIVGLSNIGSVCGYNEGVIENCYNSGIVGGLGSNIGGIVGKQAGFMNKCYNLGVITGQETNSTSGGVGVGGLVGLVTETGEICNSLNMGFVSSIDYNYVGGIAGINKGKIANIFNSLISGVEGASYVGGIVGLNEGTLISGYSIGDINGKGYYVGAIAGHNTGTINLMFYLEQTAKDGAGTVQNGIGSATLGQTKTDIAASTYVFKVGGEMETINIDGNNISDLLSALLAAHARISRDEDNKYIVWRLDIQVYAPVLYESGTPPLNWLTTNTSTVFNGSGTVDNPYIIESMDDMKTFVTYVNAGRSFAGEYVKLMANIDAEGSASNQWNPIGRYDAENERSNYFAGHFDGNGYSIINVYIDRSTDNYQGVFGYNTGTIKNLTVSGTITGATYVGGLCGYNTGSVLNCANLCDVIATGSYVGGLVGVSNGLIEKSYSVKPVKAINGTFGLAVGGLVGINLTNGQIKTSYASGAVTADTYQWTGGLVGQNTGSLFNSYAGGNVTGSYYVGGIAGQNGGGTVTNCIAYGTVKGGNTYVGGSVGYNSGKLEYTYYLIDNAKDGNNNIQGGIGQEALASKLSDATNMYMSFNTDLKLTNSTNISGTQVYDVLTALNTFVISDRQSGRPNDSWLRGYNGYPIFGFYDTCWDGVAIEPYETGSGTANDPYQIANGAQLRYLQQQTAAGVTYENTYFVLINDIYLNNISISTSDANVNVWEPIINFAGNFDGKNFAVHGVFIKDLSDYQGLFGNVTGNISNLCTFDGYIEGLQYVGGVAGWTDGSIINCYNSNIIHGYGNYIGGIVGNSAGLINSCGNSGAIYGVCNSIGGISGKSTNAIYNSFNLGDIDVEGEMVGGITGNILINQVINCYNTGNIKATAIVGGIVGQNEGEVANVYNLGTVSADTNYCGGVIGFNKETASETYYLINSVAINNVVQNGIGIDEGVQVDDLQISAPYNQNYHIQTINVLGVSASKLSDALNIYVDQNAVINGVLLFKWTTDGVPNFQRFWQGGINPMFAGGDGSETNPYQIATAEHLAYLAYCVNNGDDFFSKYFVLTDNIYLNDELFTFDSDSGLVKVSDGGNLAYLGTGIIGDFGGVSEIFDYTASSAGTWYSSVDGNAGSYSGVLYEWTPIGNLNANTGVENDFAGFFDGAGYTISGLYINNNENNQGLFGHVSGVIRNIGITNSYVAGKVYVGGIVSSLTGIAENLYNDATVIANTKSAGGISGYLSESASIYNVYNLGKIWSPENAGGISGETYGTVNNVYNWGNVYVETETGTVLGFEFSENIGENIFVWQLSALTENYTDVTLDNIGLVQATLNEYAVAQNYYEWQIDEESGMPRFITDILWDGTASDEYAGGAGTAQVPYLIENANELKKYLDSEDHSISVKLTKDIYLNDETFTFIADTGLIKVTDGTNVAYFGTGIAGDTSGANAVFDGAPSQKAAWYTDDMGTLGAYSGTLYEWTGIEDFSGTFDGADFTIYGLYSSNGGFITNMENATVKNLNIASSLVYGNVMVGGIINESFGGTISNCSNSGIVIGGDAGGIVGKISANVVVGKEHTDSGYYETYKHSRTSIINCLNAGVIIGSGTAGIVSYAEFVAEIQDCYNIGNIYASAKAAGIIQTYNGRFEENNNTVTISNCHNYGKIKGKDYSAGIIAYMIGGESSTSQNVVYLPSKVNIENVTNNTAIIGSTYTAGIIGYGDKGSAQLITLKNAHNYADISGGSYSAGIIGRFTYLEAETLSNSGVIHGVASIGGIVGYGAVKINGANNTGAVTGSSNVGGISGYHFNASYPIQNAYNFADVQASSMAGGIVGRLSANGLLDNVYNSGDVEATHSVGGVVGQADTGTIQNSYVASHVSGEYFVGGIIGNATEDITYVNAYYPYGLIKADNSPQKEHYGIGLDDGLSSEGDVVEGISMYQEDTVMCVDGSVQVIDKSLFLEKVEIAKLGAEMFIIENNDTECLLNGKTIVPSEYGIYPNSGRSVVLAYQAKGTVTLYVNGMGEFVDEVEEWTFAYQNQTASKVLSANTAIGTLPVPVDEYYAFAGWYVDSACLSYQITESSIYDFSFTKLYAKWEVASYTITIDVTGIGTLVPAEGWDVSGDKLTATKVVSSIEPIGALPALESEGYVFDGWYSDESYRNRIIPSSLFWARQDAQMYPKLTPNTFDFSIRLNELEWANSGITISVCKVATDLTETVVWTQSDIMDTRLVVDQTFTAGTYKVYASRKHNKLSEMQELTQVYVQGTTSVMVDYYSLTLTKGDEGINTVYIVEENDIPVPMQDIHNSSQIYLTGQKIIVSAVVAEGNGYAWNYWIDQNSYTTVSDQDLVIDAIDTSYVLRAISK